ncbi:hypothetical protein K1T71_008610 [Dendrolimus kikuchii]|uniref:Uncharacterized protein n=1 Tax=Dendrolimus kikuchii TaxID=765133 RepID=A0ACC1CV47_9NEOP|nr:hypothetical protein K1T71_008610 [Dendrolimus kikuchii]
MLFYYESIESFRNTTKSINPFQIPDILREEFFDDYIEMATNMGLVKKAVGSSVVKMKYNLIVVFGRK